MLRIKFLIPLLLVLEKEKNFLSSLSSRTLALGTAFRNYSCSFCLKPKQKKPGMETRALTDNEKVANNIFIFGTLYGSDQSGVDEINGRQKCREKVH